MQRRPRAVPDRKGRSSLWRRGFEPVSKSIRELYEKTHQAANGTAFRAVPRVGCKGRSSVLGLNECGFRDMTI